MWIPMDLLLIQHRPDMKNIFEVKSFELLNVRFERSFQMELFKLKHLMNPTWIRGKGSKSCGIIKTRGLGRE